MKKTLIILLAIIAIVSTVFWSMRLDVKPGGGMISISLDSKASAQESELTSSLDEYTGDELTKLSDTQYVIDYFGTKSMVEIGSVDKEIVDFKPDLTVRHWNDEVSFSLIAPATIDSKSELTADLSADKVIASNGEWNFEYFATVPNDFNEYGGIDIIITAKEKPASNKIYFTYDSTTVTPYYQGELDAKEIEEGASRPEHIVGSIAFYADGKANHAIGDVNYATGKVGHLYAMRAGTEWARWSIEGEYIVLTIPDKVYNGKYPVIISPVGDTFGYTSAGGTNTGSDNRIRMSLYTCGAAGTATSMSIYAYESGANNNIRGVYYAATGGAKVDETEDGTIGLAVWNHMDFSGTPAVSSANYYLGAMVDDGLLYYDTGSNAYLYYVYSWDDAAPVNTSSFTASSNRNFSIYITYTPSGGDPDISISPTDYDFGVVAESTEPYTATDYFTITNSSTMQTDQTIAVTTSSWSGGVTWTHSDTATAGSDTAGLKSNRGGTWGSGDVIVKYSSPNYIYENCPATTNYDFGLKLISPTAFTDGVEKEIVVRITATAD